MRVLFMGTPDFSVPTLKAIIEAGHEVVGVVTQPDKPKGRGKQMQKTPVKAFAEENGLSVYQPEKVKDPAFLELAASLAPDVMVVVAFGQILPKAILELPKYGCINVHASLLPKLRGAGPIQWSIINGDEKSGVTTMQMDVGLDTGDMLLKTEVAIEADETGGSLHDKLSEAGASLLIETLDAIESGSVSATPQVETEASYAPMLDKTLGNIDWKKTAEEIERLIRGLNPWPSAYTRIGGKLLKIWSAEVVELDEQKDVPGTVLTAEEGILMIQCGENALLVRELQLEGKKRMDVDDFLRGHTVEKGIRL